MAKAMKEIVVHRNGRVRSGLQSCQTSVCIPVTIIPFWKINPAILSVREEIIQGRFYADEFHLFYWAQLPWSSINLFLAKLIPFQ